MLRPSGDYQVIRDDDTLLRRPGNEVATEDLPGRLPSRNIVTQPDGTQVITVRDRDPADPAPDRRPPRRHANRADRRTSPCRRPVVVSELPQVRPGHLLRHGDHVGRCRRAGPRARRAVGGGAVASASRRSARSGRCATSPPRSILENVTFATGSRRDLARPGDATAVARALHGRRPCPQPARGLPDRGPYRRDRLAPRSTSVLSDRRAETVALRAHRVLRGARAEHGHPGLWRGVPAGSHARERAAEPPGYPVGRIHRPCLRVADAQ